MTERQKEFLTLTILLAVLIGLFSPVLFTSKIVRAPDILNEYFWTVKDIGNMPFLDIFKVNISSAGWSMYQKQWFYTTRGAALRWRSSSITVWSTG